MIETTHIDETRVGLIKSHLFNNLEVLDNIKTKKRNYLGKHMSIKVENENEILTYLDVNLTNQIDGFNCFAKKNPVIISKDYRKPITLGIDTSYGIQNQIIKGSVCYAWITALSTMIDGDVSEEVLAEVKNLNRYVIMLSDKLFEQKKGQNCLVPHHRLQENMFNMLKVVSEGKMISEPLKKITKTLSEYNYKYEKDKATRVIIIKDGPLISGFFEPFGDALLTNKFTERLEDENEIYKTIALAGLRGIPLVGLTKHAQYSALAQHFEEKDVLDYSIIKQIAESDTYFYIGPLERKHKKNPQFKINYYYLFLEDRFSPLRLEIIPNLLPPNISEKDLVEDILSSLKISDEGELNDHKGEDYKLPICIALADQYSRDVVKKESAKIYEKINELAKKIPGAIVDTRM